MKHDVAQVRATLINWIPVTASFYFKCFYFAEAHKSKKWAERVILYHCYIQYIHCLLCNIYSTCRFALAHFIDGLPPLPPTSDFVHMFIVFVWLWCFGFAFFYCYCFVCEFVSVCVRVFMFLCECVWLRCRMCVCVLCHCCCRWFCLRVCVLRVLCSWRVFFVCVCLGCSCMFVCLCALMHLRAVCYVSLRVFVFVALWVCVCVCVCVLVRFGGSREDLEAFGSIWKAPGRI